MHNSLCIQKDQLCNKQVLQDTQIEFEARDVIGDLELSIVWSKAYNIATGTVREHRHQCRP